MASRRSLLMTAAAAPLALEGCAVTEVKTFPTIASALQAIDSLGAGARTTQGWTLSQVLNHVAQSIEYSMYGFPSLNSALFRATIGKAAFVVFDSRGKMSHPLTDPIPGAPALPADAPLPAAKARIAVALLDFEAFLSPLSPHFAYGALDKTQFTRAHLMHLAEHWTAVVAA
jgi:hypothetical protein